MLWRQQVLPGDCIHPGSLSRFIRALSGRGGWAQRNKRSFFTASKKLQATDGSKICFNSESKWQHEMSKVYMLSDLESDLHINSASSVFSSTSFNTVPQILYAAVPSGKVTEQKECRWNSGDAWLESASMRSS